MIIAEIILNYTWLISWFIVVFLLSCCTSLMDLNILYFDVLRTWIGMYCILLINIYNMFSAFVSASFNSFMSYAYMYYQHLRELSSSGLHWPHCMLSFHGFLWATFLNLHWFVHCFPGVVSGGTIGCLQHDIDFSMDVLLAYSFP